VTSLELVLDGNPSVPWTVLYDQELSPDTQQAFLTGSPDDMARWRPFWGIRYKLAAGPRVDPLRRRSAPPTPNVLLVLDGQVREGLPEGERQRLQKFICDRGLRSVESRADLEQVLCERRPDLMYWLCHATPAGLHLGEAAPCTPDDPYRLLERSPL